MSFQRRLAANYASQIYVTLIGIVMVPMYIRYMGTEAYGLVGFFAMLQAWFQLLDLGLTPTLAREAARYLGGASTALHLRQFLKALERVFLGIAFAGAGAVILGAHEIATQWLRVEHLSAGQVELSIGLMAGCIALRWLCGLYRSLINGFEQQVWLGKFNASIATARFVLVIPFFLIIGTEPTQFFLYQLLIASVETVLVARAGYRLLPPLPPGVTVRAEWRALRGTLKFALMIAFTSSLWVFVTQTDKLILSKLLSLSDYAHFSLAVLVASGVSVVSGPISGVLMPRLARLHAAGDEAGLLILYRQATQGVSIVAGAVAVTLAFCAKPLLLAWTGDDAIAQSAANTLVLYALGNGVLAVGAFPYYLQYAHGNVRLHLWGSFLFVLTLIPLVIFSTQRWGAEGAGAAWLCSNVLYLCIWVPVVHHKFAPGLHRRWITSDVMAIFASAGIAGVTFSGIDYPAERIKIALLITAIALVVMLCSVLGAATTRSKIIGRIRRSVFAANDASI